jgi:predicted Zn-dependent peptidase
MNKRILALAAAAVILAAFVTAGPVTLDVKEHVLANGMKILMIPKPGAPRVVCHIYFKVGSINERPGITGSAHVHEHLMFKGTEVMGVTDYAKESAIDARIDALMAQVYRERFWKDGGDQVRIAAWQKDVDELVKAQKAYIIKDDLWTQYMKNGGTGLNASTSQETTGYYVTLPSNKVELQMLMESDRMMNARFREFYSEKDVIMEERRLSENQPGYLFGEQVQAAFYTASPYHWDVIGWMDDLKKMTKEDLVAFHDTYYVPNNAVAIYVGDFDPAAVTAMAEKYFGRIPKGPDLEPIRTGVPAQLSEKRFYGEGPAPTSLQMMFHIPPDGDHDTAALSILAGTLGSGGGGFRGMGGGGGTGRLYKSLVRDKQLAVNASASSRPQWYAGAFQFNATPRVDKGVKPEDLEKEIWAEIDKVKKEGLTDEEIQKAKNKGEAAFVRGLSSAAGLASRVGRAELKRGWRSILTDLEDLQKVTNDDIKRVAAKYLVKDNGLTAIYTRKTGR